MAYVVGLFSNVLLGSRWVFRARTSKLNLVKFGILHIFSYLIGSLIISALDPVQVSEVILSAVLIASLTTPINFLGGRHIFAKASEPCNDVTKKVEGV